MKADFPYLAEGYFALPSDDQLLAMNPDEIFALAQRVVAENHAGWSEFRQTLNRLGIQMPTEATGAALPPVPVAEKLVDDAAATADRIATALQNGEWKQHVDEISHLYPQPDQVIAAMGGTGLGIARTVKQKLAALGIDATALGQEIQAAGQALFGECTLAEQLVLEANVSDPTQPKSPETKAIDWAAQTYPGEGPDDPDTFYPRKNPKHVLEARPVRPAPVPAVMPPDNELFLCDNSLRHEPRCRSQYLIRAASIRDARQRMKNLDGEHRVHQCRPLTDPEAKEGAFDSMDVLDSSDPNSGEMVAIAQALSTEGWYEIWSGT